MLGKIWVISKKIVWMILLFGAIAIAGSVGKQLAKAWMTKSDTEKFQTTAGLNPATDRYWFDQNKVSG